MFTASGWALTKIIVPASVCFLLMNAWRCCSALRYTKKMENICLNGLMVPTKTLCLCCCKAAFCFNCIIGAKYVNRFQVWELQWPEPNYNDRNPILMHGFSLLAAILRKKRTPKRKPAGHHQALAAKKINLVTTVLRPFPTLLASYFQTPVCNINMNCFILCFAAARYLSCFLQIFFLFCLSRLWAKQRVRLLLWLLEYRKNPLLLILSQTLLWVGIMGNGLVFQYSLVNF